MIASWRLASMAARGGGQLHGCGRSRQCSAQHQRELAGVDDVLLAYKHFLAFFRWAPRFPVCVTAGCPCK
jgi:hypothetical protein